MMRSAAVKLMTAASVAAALMTLGCQDKINYLKARNELNKGVKAFQMANFPQAAEYFDTALELDPELIAARSYRASAYMMQYIPGGESEENLQVAREALEGFQEVLRRDPDNQVAMQSIASLYFNMKDFEKAKEAYRELIEKYPDHKEAYYTIGVIDWTQTYQPRLEVRSKLGMKPEDPGPIKDREAREELAERNLPLIEEGLEMLEKALEVDPDYDDAMAYMNLLYRERADLMETKEEYEKYSSIADEWVQKALETKKRKAEAATVDTFAEE